MSISSMMAMGYWVTVSFQVTFDRSSYLQVLPSPLDSSSRRLSIEKAAPNEEGLFQKGEK